MKKLSLFLILLTFLSFGCSEKNTNAEQKEQAVAKEENPVVLNNVVDYFHLLSKYEFQINNIKLEKKDDKWVAYQKELEEEMECIVDIPNGYIKITEDGGAGRAFYELALFKTSMERTIVALNTYSEMPMLRTTSVKGGAPKFFSIENGKHVDITSKVFPVTVNPGDFFSNQKAGCLSNEMYYKLPQQGTSIKVLLNTAMCNFCDKKKIELMTELNEFELACCTNFCPNVIKKEIILPFNKEKGMFEWPKQ